MKDAKIKYYLEIADNALILSHRLSENSSNGPFLEEDLACTNVALDLIGMAESLYNGAAELSDEDVTGDDLAYRRDEWNYYNTLLVEQPNNDFAHLMIRQFFTDAFNYYFLTELSHSNDEYLSAVGAKSLKEVTYHLRRSTEWMIRFGNGTVESFQRATAAINDLWRYTDEMFIPTEADLKLRESGISADLEKVKEEWNGKINEVLYLSTLKKPENQFQLNGGKEGRHSEYMGYILTEMQYLTNRYPEATW